MQTVENKIDKLKFEEYEEVTIEAATYVQEILKSKLSSSIIVAKNYALSKKKKNAQKLIKQAQIRSTDQIALFLALELTDVGFVHSIHTPYLESPSIAQSFLQKRNLDDDIIERVIGCLHLKLQTSKPNSYLEEIYLDVDRSVLAAKSYVKKVLPSVMEEHQVNIYNPVKTRDWLKKHQTYLKNITFYTEEAKEKYKSGIKRNIKKIKRLRKAKKEEISAYNMPLDKSKGVQMMFKTALRNHIDLSSIADNKASIMLSINAIIITIAMPLLIRYMSGNGYLIIPMVTLMITCVLSIILAALATRPAETNGETDINKVMEKRSSNLFFFGNFYNVSLENYQAGMRKVIRSNEVLERSAINDLYFLGKSLGDKFNLLRACYMVFMVGIAISVLMYGVVLYWS